MMLDWTSDLLPPLAILHFKISTGYGASRNAANDFLLETIIKFLSNSTKISSFQHKDSRERRKLTEQEPEFLTCEGKSSIWSWGPWWYSSGRWQQTSEQQRWPPWPSRRRRQLAPSCLRPPRWLGNGAASRPWRPRSPAWPGPRAMETEPSASSVRVEGEQMKRNARWSKRLIFRMDGEGEVMTWTPRWLLYPRGNCFIFWSNTSVNQLAFGRLDDSRKVPPQADKFILKSGEFIEKIKFL